MRSRFGIFAILLVLGGCAGAIPESKPQPMDGQGLKPRPVVQPVTPAPAPRPIQPEGHWTEWPLARGNWVYSRDNRGSLGYFGETGKNALVTLRCDKARNRIYLSRAGELQQPQIQVKTSSTSKVLTAASAGGTPSYVAAELSTLDPILDAMAYSRGRFTVEASGHQPLAIPAWAEISRIIEDCRG
jgi:hypothetical protein